MTTAEIPVTFLARAQRQPSEKGFSEMVNKATATDNEIVITEHGRRPGTALIARVEYESFRETLNILSDPDMMAGIAEAESDIEAGRLIELP